MDKKDEKVDVVKGEMKECECTCPQGKTARTPIQNHWCMNKKKKTPSMYASF